MRVLMRATVPVEAGNKGMAEGLIQKTIGDFTEQFKPEAAYFLAERGQRTALFVFDLKDPSDLPVAAEGFFFNLSASVEVIPVMNAAELKRGMERLTKRR